MGQLPSEPAKAPAADSFQQLTPTATLTAALVGIGALLPNKLAATIIGMLAPFVSAGIMWLVREHAQEWLAERRAQAPTRRAVSYLQEMEKQLQRLPATAPNRPQLEAHIRQLHERLHQHRMGELILVAPPATPTTSSRDEK